MSRTISAIFALFMLAVAPQGAEASQCEPQKVAEKYPDYANKPVLIAASPVQPPFAYADPTNPERMDGLEVELIENAMACAGVKYQWIKESWGALLPALFAGTSDVMIGAVNYRPDRAEKADFIVYMRAGQAVIVHKGNPKNISDMESLCGMTGSTVIGGTGVQTIEDQSKACSAAGKPEINFQPAQDSDSAYRQLTNDRVDFVLNDAPAAAARAKISDVEITYVLTTDIFSGMVVTKGNTEMRTLVADGLKAQQDDGRLKEIAMKYGLPVEMLIPVQTRE